MKRARLFTPGPTAVPPEVLEVQSRPLIHHRTDEFKQALVDVTDGLKYIMPTENPVVVLEVYQVGKGQVAKRTFTWDEVLGVSKIKALKGK